MISKHAQGARPSVHKSEDEEIDDDILANEENGLSARSLSACTPSFL